MSKAKRETMTDLERGYAAAWQHCGGAFVIAPWEELDRYTKNAVRWGLQENAKLIQRGIEIGRQLSRRGGGPGKGKAKKGKGKAKKGAKR